MKLTSNVNEVVLSNTGTAGEFRIRNSAKAFKILSDGLYSNKIRAIIRELSCNALDSHVGAGKKDVPFEVHLPTILEPWFSVKDYGLGLDNKQVINIYTTYFESTKTDSNDYIGALGLGSKSPFSYTENFTVTAIKDGMKRIYSAFINESGVPSIVEMSKEKTDEGNGVEVKFSVTERYDYQSFRSEAQKTFIWFEHRPKITGVDNYVQEEIRYLEKNIVPGVHTFQDGRSSMAVMGNIAYPLNNIPDPQKHFGDLSQLLNCGLVFTFGIGELDFAASREQLSYIPQTIRSIKQKLEELNAGLAKYIAQKAEEIPNLWLRADYLATRARTSLHGAAVKKYVTDSKFPLYDPDAYYGKKSLSFDVVSLTKRGLSMQAFRSSNGSSYNIKEVNRHDGKGNYIATISFSVDADAVIVLNDLKTGALARARYHFNNHFGKSSTVYCISHDSEDVEVRQKEYDKLMKEIYNPPVIMKASTLQKQVRSVSTPKTSTGIAYLGMKSQSTKGDPSAYAWYLYEDPLEKKKIYHYVLLDGHQSIDDTGAHFAAKELRGLLHKSGIKELEELQIYGVRKHRVKEIKALKNWIWIEEAVKTEVAKISDAHVDSLVAATELDNWRNRVYNSAKVVKAVGEDSDYAKYIKSVKNLTAKQPGDLVYLAQLCQKYGKTIHIDAVKKKISDSKTAIHKKYPLLKLFREGSSDTNEDDVAHYIKLVDKQE